MKKMLLLLSLAMVLLALCPGQLLATSYTSVAAGAWDSPNTWNPFGVPGAADSATVVNSVTVSGTQYVNALSVINGGILTINASSTLDLTVGVASIYVGATVNGPGTVQIDNTCDLTVPGTFAATLLVSSGTTTGYEWGNGVGYSPTGIFGPIIVAAGANLQSRWISAFGSITNNGTISDSNFINEFDYNGPSFTNNGTVSVTNFHFSANNVAQNVSGAGLWSDAGITISNGSIVTLTGEVTFGPTGLQVGVDNGTAGSIALNGYKLILHRPGGNVYTTVEGNGTVSGAGTFQTDESVDLTVEGDFGAVFSSELLVNSGTTTGHEWGNGVNYSPTALTGTVTIANGATLAPRWIKASGSVTNNGSIANSTFINTLDLNASSITNAGTISISNFHFILAGTQEITGTGAWTGDNISLSNGTIVTPMNSLTLGATNLTVGDFGSAGTLATNGKTVIIHRPDTTVNVTVTGTGTVSGAGTVQTDELADITVQGDFGGVFSAPLLVNSGTTTGHNWGNGNGYSPTAFSGPITVPAGATLKADNWISSSGVATINGALTYGTCDNNGALNGTGTISTGVLNNNGTLAPGFSLGELTCTGAIGLPATSNLSFEVGGTGQGTTYDWLNDTYGNGLTLGGALSVTLVNGFVPQPTDTFTLLSATSTLLGAFSNVANGQRLTTTDGVGSFVVRYGSVGMNDDATAATQVVLSDFQPAVPNATVAVSPSRVKEGESASYTVSLSAPATQNLTLKVAMNGTATLITDYTLTGAQFNGNRGRVTIPAGQSSVTVTLNAISDGLTEGTETAIMTLSSGSGYGIGNPRKATVRISDP